MVLDEEPGPQPPDADGVSVQLVSDQDDLPLLDAIARVAFGTSGTAIGAAGLEQALAKVESDPAALAVRYERLRTGRTIQAMALVAGRPVGTGSYQPLGSVAEVVGVGVLPAFRRRGIAAMLTSHLVEDALKRGIRTVFLSAGDETVGRIYRRVGFRRVGTACTAEPPPHSTSNTSSNISI
jgi:ribosomal protein S18 acetylase RimI-like enzyme